MKELINKMQKLGIRCVTLDKNSGKVLLDENGDLSYNKGLLYYSQTNYAFENAFTKLGKYEDKLLQWKDIVSSKFSTRLIYHNDDGNERTESIAKWVWKSDITDSGISVKDEFVIEGNINQLREFNSYANKHFRYCHGCYYKYDNEELKEWMEIFQTFNLYKAYDSFSEYYHNSIVD